MSNETRKTSGSERSIAGWDSDTEASTEATDGAASASPVAEGRPSPRASTKGRVPRSGRAVTRGSSHTVIPLLVALVLTLVLQQLLNTTIPADSYVYRLFRPSGAWILGVVPGLIAFIFIWTLTDLALKLRVALVNERDLDRPAVRKLPAAVSGESSRVTLHRLTVWDRNLLGRPVGRRLMWLLRHLDSVDAQRAHELVRHQSDLDADSAHSGYRAVRLFVWAMPILGFIGTVLGISLSVGGFSEFLTANVSIDEIDAVTSELGEVASGLSFAFDTTLLGLLAGLVANVIASGVQGREERFITGLEELGLRILSEARTHAPPSDPATSRDGDAALAKKEIDELVRSHLEALSVEIDQLTYTVRRGLQSLTEASSRVSRGMEGSMKTVNEGMDRLAEEVNGASTGLSGNMRAIEEANERLARTLGSLAPVLERLTEPMDVKLVPRPLTPPPHRPESQTSDEE